jgi:hypothetical protein
MPPTPAPPERFILESRPKKRSANNDPLRSFMSAADDWQSDGLGDNAPRAYEECERDVRLLECSCSSTGLPRWADTEYRIRRVRA